MIEFKMLHPSMKPDYLGLVPFFLNENDPRSAREQIDENYQHGGGWRSIEGFELVTPPSDLLKQIPPYKIAKDLVIQYPNDPPLSPLAVARLHDETLMMYNGAWFAIFQTDYSFEIARLD